MCESSNVPKRAGDDLVARGASTAKVKKFCPGIGKTSQPLSDGASVAKLSPTVPGYQLVVKNTSDNIWRDENLVPVVTEDDEIYVIDNA